MSEDREPYYAGQTPSITPGIGITAHVADIHNCTDGKLSAADAAKLVEEFAKLIDETFDGFDREAARSDE